ncbi:hypothetical protein [Corynebacterium marinum]|uniref:Uncharacterized protein n=1 Tax=Corynebacterium marinum DSM 44953 TaxID=1224162 RepID=A0A0B6TUR5_9CORY|nr:hypothetical protein [Corynebacterium marinum]AJK68471.1 hypothetical protein B840_04260 [Corynebacterium marinum DSM 44953]GGO15086.1 hypothetical protein GCM10010980_10160 [Corynebacterium marinum]
MVETGTQFPTKEIEHRTLYLRPRHVLAQTPEPPGTGPTGMMGTGAARTFAAIDQDDTNFILRLWDIAPNGKRLVLPYVK